MRLFFYYVFHTFINSIKKLFKTWIIVVIAVSMVFGLVVGLGTGQIVKILQRQEVIESDEGDVTEEEYIEQNEEINRSMTVEEKEEVMQIVNFSVFAAIFVILLFYIYTGDKGGAAIFTMADVNLLFPSPRRPQSILMFKIFLQMGLIFVSSIWLIVQLPNLKISLGLSVLETLSILCTWFLTFAFAKLLSVMVYTLAATYERVRGLVRPVTIGVASLVVLYYAYIIKTTLAVPIPDKILFVPIWGQLTNVAMAGVQGNANRFLMYIAILIAELILLVWIIWHIKADFYEDAFVNATQTKEKLDAAKTGMTAKKHSKRIKRGEDVLGSTIFGEGSQVFFKKTLYNRHRFAKFGIFTNTSLTYLAGAVLFSILDMKVMQSGSLVVIGIIFMFIAYFRNYGNPLEIEWRTRNLFLVPQSPHKKVFCAMAGGSYETMLDLLPAMVVAVIMLKASAFSGLCWLLAIVCMDFLASGTGLILNMVFPENLNQNIAAMLQLLLKLLALLPLIIVMAVFGAAGGINAALLASAVCNGVLGTGMLFLSGSLLHKGRN